ncbi:MAG: S8 family serine peptidase [Bacteroidota bacterium]|nr:S8 family serine peptidase [Bacteroidota bacterium]MDP4229862.1 S8 family serine peptidase [Bacteroidota bacterium]MDP4237167.1 S8 family serine peptidase [Bacteroidota bacterium]
MLLSATSLFLLLALFLSPTQILAQSKYWIVFKDKGITAAEFKPGNAIFDKTVSEISAKALKRRAAALGVNSIEKIVTIEDAPINAKYVDSLRKLGIQPVTISNWANAFSAYLSQEQLQLVKSQSFVVSTKPIPSANSNTKEIEERTSIFLPRAIPSNDDPEVLPIPAGYDTIIYHYGLTDSQIHRINVPPLHAMGFDGRGVMLGFLDVGFRWQAMRTTLMHHVIAEYDFIFHDSSTANDSLDVPDQDGHGSSVLSAGTGFFPDNIMGPAYNPDLLLAKTEDVRSERPIEEDNYAAALEWMEKLGVDITSSSLGYYNFDSGYVSHTYADMNGRTTISAKACERAAKLGVLCCTAMGNGGSTGYSYTLTPADADSIISVGALDVTDTIAGFSSRGPTFDKRLKPEICAPGVSVWTMTHDDTFAAAGGTSLATPLVSGACALIKQAHPEASAQAIRKAIIKTGRLDFVSSPDTAYGFGRLDAYSAALSLGTIIGTVRTWRVDSIHHVEVGIAANNGVKNPRVIFGINNEVNLTNILPLSLAADSLIYTATFPRLPKGTHVRYYIATNDGADTTTVLPRNASDSVFEFHIGDTIISAPFGVHDVAPVSDLVVMPNPARENITVRVQTDEAVNYMITDALGRSVLEYAAVANIHELRIRVDGFAPGVYHLHARTRSGSLSGTVKFIVIQ